MTTAVFTDHAPYRRALGGLTASTARAVDARGAVVGLAGDAGWMQRVEAARAGGAVAAVVDDPATAADDSPAPLSSSAFPVILERPRLRHDLCIAAALARAGVPARAVVVECAGSEAASAGLLGDGIGWARVLAGGELVLRSVGRSAGGFVCLLAGPGDLPVTVVFTWSGPQDGGGLLRASALGETRSEVTVDLLAGAVEIDTVSAAGTFRAPPRHESSNRLALRRAVQAAGSGEPVGDLFDFRHDSALADAIRREVHQLQ
ncbi:hypothetical protein B7R21_09630 [Subtercola boreus]|uniref:Gfo/Idh/MocA-like oxidoreductase N-terminal domain-containing protein n=1 Tax=Subtercola boreus TaxID=120213 RepID=A0A3E0VT66_9MICO|nr:hypothetical protein [Subtercola boreus]RFA12598.1 hypothetical protein B7R21_09630 [Subtercola boreus]